MKVIVYTTGGTNRDAIDDPPRIVNLYKYQHCRQPREFQTISPLYNRNSNNVSNVSRSLVRAIIETDLLKIFHRGISSSREEGETR